MLRRYVVLLEEEFEERGVMGRLKQFASQVTRRVRGSKYARRALCQSRKISEFSDVLNQWEEYLLARQNRPELPGFMDSSETSLSEARESRETAAA